MKNPYEILPENAFWKLSVSDRNMFNISGIWESKFEFKKDQKYVTFGSCFAQYIGSFLKRNGFDCHLLKVEAPTSVGSLSIS